MPIRPEHRHHYEGPAWAATRKLILRRAQNKCECKGECGSGKHVGARCGRADRSEYRNEHNKLVWVVLTVAHLDHDPTHQDPDRLKALCPACHLRYDHAHHMSNAAATRRRKLSNLELDLDGGTSRVEPEGLDEAGPPGGRPEHVEG